MRTGRVGEDALRVAGLVLKACQHLIEPLVAQLLEEPLDVGAWQSPHSIKAQARVFHHHCSSHLHPARLVVISRAAHWQTDNRRHSQSFQTAPCHCCRGHVDAAK